MKQTILANARYWLRTLGATAGDALLPEADLRSAARAIEAALTELDMGAITWKLALALHPHMEQRGHWADWSGFLQILILRARQQNEAEAEAELLLRRGVIQRQQVIIRGQCLPAAGHGSFTVAAKAARGKPGSFPILGICIACGDNSGAQRCFAEPPGHCWAMKISSPSEPVLKTHWH